MTTEDLPETDGFFQQLQGMKPSPALDLCLAQGKQWKGDLMRLQTQLAQTPRGDKAGAHAIKQSMLHVQLRIKQLRPVTMDYMARVDRREAQTLWAAGVAAVCGKDKLAEVYAWMSAERKARREQSKETL